MDDAAALAQNAARSGSECGRIEQITVIDAHGSDRRIEPQTEPDRVGHAREIDITYAWKYIAEVVERYQLQALCERIAQFEVEDRECITANRHQRGRFIGRARLQHCLRARLFKTEAAQRRCAAGKEAFANRQEP